MESAEDYQNRDDGQRSVRPRAVYTIIEGERLRKPIFRRIGSAFVNRDASLNVVLEALPVDGKLHIREQREPREQRDLGRWSDGRGDETKLGDEVVTLQVDPEPLGGEPLPF